MNDELNNSLEMKSNQELLKILSLTETEEYKPEVYAFIEKLLIEREVNLNEYNNKIAVELRSIIDEVGIGTSTGLNLGKLLIYDKCIVFAMSSFVGAAAVGSIFYTLGSYLSNKSFNNETIDNLKNTNSNTLIHTFGSKFYFLNEEIKNLEIVIPKLGNITLKLVLNDDSFLFKMSIPKLFKKYYLNNNKVKPKKSDYAKYLKNCFNKYTSINCVISESFLP